ncbi:hypothetical protein [Ichthyobacterium seriolicida]|uniref:Uncharacterized protein n=1 Tax=Ichthyobacterium seriolicida TaxID=242600 RepID=A0A1J1E1X0_9FLAO|nr:hypothetical protein [Ichthyobacterium seriolicida]BAV94028.1 hypothetical protein JBKA6_0015 [Ichthyobacterium seriolicida]
MKTNILFKNTLSLLTLGLVVFSCTKPTEGPKTEEDTKADIQKAIANIKTIAFTKDKNSATGNTSATEAYAALFIKKTPALAYTDKSYDKFEARIESNGVIKVFVPFDKTLNITAATLKATITFNGKIGPNIYLGDSTTSLDSTITSFDYDITTELIHSKLIKPEGISHSFKLSRKEKDSNPIEKVCKVVFVHDKPSKDCTIGPNDFKFTVNTSNINTVTNLTPVGSGSPTAPTANSTIKAHYVASVDTDYGTEDKPFEFQLRKSASGTSNLPGELKTDGVDASAYFKADALKLPDGAYIEVSTETTACGSNDCNNVNPITGIKTGGSANSSTTDLKGPSTSGQKIEYKFIVVAQDGTSKKYYKLTINADAPPAAPAG